jgi:hypothetical protein
MPDLSAISHNLSILWTEDMLFLLLSLSVISSFFLSFFFGFRNATKCDRSEDGTAKRDEEEEEEETDAHCFSNLFLQQSLNSVIES